MRIYFRSLAIFGAIAVLLSIKNVAATLMWSVFIVGPLIVPLFYSATIFIYLACLAPLIVFWSKNHSVLPASVFSMVLFAVVGLGPSWISEMQAKEITTTLIAQDFPATAPLTGRSIEIIRARNFTPRIAWKPFKNDSWGKVWEALLLSGQVDWIRFSVHPGNRKVFANSKGTPTISYFRSAKGAQCQIPGLPVQEGEQCVRMFEDSRQPADIHILLSEEKRAFPFELNSSWLIKPVSWRMLSIQKRQGNEYQEVLRQSEAQIKTVFQPLVFQPEGVVTWSIGRRFNPINLQKFLDKLGFALKNVELGKSKPKPEDLKRQPTEEETKQVVWIFALPGHETFNREQSRFINQWLYRAKGYEEWTPERMEFLRKIIRDSRMFSLANVTSIFRLHEEVAKALLPDVLDMIEAKKGEYSQNESNKRMLGLRYLKAELLTPHADRFLKLIKASTGKTRRQLLYISGKIGVNPIPFTGPINLKKPGQDTGAQIKGLCLSELQWSNEVLPVLRSLITSQELGKESAKPYARYVLKALARHGDFAYAKELEAQANWSDGSNILRQISRDLRKYGNSEIHCA